MKEKLYEYLLKNRKVIEEISRHQWIESEKAGKEISFDKAAADWLERFSEAWMRYHMPDKISLFKKKAAKGSSNNSTSNNSHIKNKSR